MNWQAIPDFPGYEISDTGKVRSFKTKSGKLGLPHEVTPVLMDPIGWAVRLNKEGKRYLRSLARLVLVSFEGDHPEARVGYRDGNSFNLKLENLYWKDRE